MNKNQILKMICAVLLFSSIEFATPLSIQATSTPMAVEKDGNVFLGNSKMEVGINKYGTFGSTIEAPEGFNPWQDPSNSGYIGMVSADINGVWGNTRDYFLPGTVDEGFAFAWSESADVPASSRAGIQSSSRGGASIKTGNYTDVVTKNTTVGSTLSALTTAKVNDVLDYSQSVSFEGDSAVAKIVLNLTNTSTEQTLYNVEYLRGFDPDQPLEKRDWASEYTTNNYYHKDKDNTVWVIASTNITPAGDMSFDDFVKSATSPFIFMAPQGDNYTVEGTQQGVGWSYNGVSNVGAVGSGAKYRYDHSEVADTGMGLRFSIKSIAPDETVTITYYMSLDANIESALKDLQAGTISKQPESMVVEKDGTVDLSVDLKKLFEDDSNITTDTTFTYQWYVSDSEGKNGTAIDGAIDAAYSAPTDTIGTKYYYCVVTPSGIDAVTTGEVRLEVIETKEEATLYKVSFDANTTDTVTRMPGNQTISSGNVALEPLAPLRAGFEHNGWYTSADCSTKWNFNTTVSEDMTFYSKWTNISEVVLESSSSTAELEEDVVLTASFSESYKPSGDVQFYHGDILLGTVSLSDGVASLTVNDFPLMTNGNIKAVYIGSDPIKTAEAVISQTINKITKDLSVEEISDHIFTWNSTETAGEFIEPTIKVNHKEKKLTLGTDYDVVYKNNQEVGEATVEITLKGNYEGKLSTTFNINKIVPTPTVPSGLKATYGDKLQNIILPTGFTFEDSLSTSTGNVGTSSFDVTYTPEDTAHYETVTGIEVSIEVLKKEIIVTPDVLDKYYGEADIELTYTSEGAIGGEEAAFSGKLVRASGEAINEYNIVKGDLELDDNGTFIATNYQIKFDDSVKFTIKEYTTDAFATAATNPNEKDWYSAEEIVLNAPTGYTMCKTGGVHDRFSSSVTIKAHEILNASYTYYLRSSTGAISTAKTFNYSNDHTVPTGTITFKTNAVASVLNTITFDLFFKNKVDVVINAKDRLSGVDTIEYQIAEPEVDYYINGEWIDYTSLSIEANDKFMIYARITDEAGNVAILNSDDVVVYQDSVAETTSFDFVKSSENNVETTIKTNGNTVKEIKLDKNVVAASNYVVSSEEDNTTKVTFSASYLKTLTGGVKNIEVSYNPLGENVSSNSKNQYPNTTSMTANIYDVIVDTTTKTQSTKYNSEIQTPSLPTATVVGDEELTILYQDDQGEYTLTTIPSYENSGEYKVAYKLSATNHQSEYGVITYTIKELQLVWSEGVVEDKIYDGDTTTDIKVAPTLVGVLKEDVAPVITVGDVTFKTKNAGTHEIVVSGYEMAKDVNYIEPTKEPSFKDAEITAKELVLTPDTLGKFYGEEDDDLTYTWSEEVTGEEADFSGLLEREAGESIDTYVISQGTLKLIDNDDFLADNYEIKFVEDVIYEIKEYMIDDVATPKEEANDRGWYRESEITLVAPEGFTICDSNDVEDVFEATIVIDTEENKDVEYTYYLRNEDGAITSAKIFTYNNDETAPVISGVENLKFYKDDLSIDVSDLNLYEIKCNDKVVKHTFDIEGNKQESYEVIATDIADNVTKVWFMTYKDITVVYEVVGMLPADGNYSEDEKAIIKNLAEELITKLDKNIAKDDKVSVDALNKLEESYLIAAGNIRVLSTQIKLNESFEEDQRPVISSVKPQGLAVAVYGNNFDTGNKNVNLFLDVEHISTTEDSVIYNVKPRVSIEGVAATIISNDDIHAPVTFKLYIKPSFKGTVALIEHVKSDGVSEYFEKTPVFTDNDGKRYCELTVSEFSNFIVSEYSYKVSVDGVVTMHKPTDLVTLSVPTMAGHQFFGWATSDVTIEGNSFTMIEKDISITSRWSIIPTLEGIPLTGDESNMALFIMLMMGSFLGGIFLVYKKYKKEKIV